ncbi:hypothetical protein PR048_013934 [Dryococelus australis]|uniref:Reverse transcriptase n=1 Tax=Dryococelus australis TaxID=614101 RepID=A0ABQ9HTL6_9NEOP|nr:hypothetical protein PR048_013934 [Dryococelus australis]
MMKVLVKGIKEVGLEINIEKTKYFLISRCHNVWPGAIDMDRVALEKIEDFKYLGGLLNERNIVEKEILTRIQAGNRGRGVEKKKNRELRNSYPLSDIVAVLKGQRLRWYGHIMRRDRDLVKYVVERCFEGKRPRGRPRHRWLDAIKEDIRKADIPEEE